MKIKYIVGFGLLSFCKYYLKIKDYLKIKLKFVNQQSLGSFFSKSIFHLPVIEGRGVGRDSGENLFQLLEDNFNLRSSLANIKTLQL